MSAGATIAIILALAVGLSLGALGGGGSTLSIPILVYVAGMTFKEASAASLLVVCFAAIVGAVGHYRHGHVRVGAGFAFGFASIVGSLIGTRLNSQLPENALLLSFSALVLFVAYRMYLSAGKQPILLDDDEAAIASARPDQAALDDLQLDDLQPEDLHGRHTAHSRSSVTAGVKAAPVVAAPSALTGSDYAKLAIAATVVGVLTGLFGVGGGFAIVPALVIFMRFNTKDAIGTSLLVIAIITSINMFLRRDSLGGLDWAIVAPFVISTAIGVVIGLRVAKNIDADRLTKAFAVMLFLVAIYQAGDTLYAMYA